MLISVIMPCTPHVAVNFEYDHFCLVTGGSLFMRLVWTAVPFPSSRFYPVEIWHLDITLLPTRVRYLNYVGQKNKTSSQYETPEVRQGQYQYIFLSKFTLLQVYGGNSNQNHLLRLIRAPS